MTQLKNKVAIVTGAGQGIGRAMAELFAREGAIVYATGRSGNSTYEHENVIYRSQDVGDESGWAALVNEVILNHSKIDVLVNNAGIIEYDPVDNLTMDAWNRVIATNQTGTWLGMREVLPHMRKEQNGSIINVSSIWGNAAVGGAHAYHASKGALRNMSKNAAITYAADGIRVNSLHPGFTATPLTDAQDIEVNNYVISQTPMKRAGLPEEVAFGALFLASDGASFVTGSEVVVDGGYLAQ